MATILTASEVIDANWRDALAAPYRNPEPPRFDMATVMLENALAELYVQDAGSVERDAQEARLLRGMGLVAVHQGLNLSFAPQDAAEQLPVVDDCLERAHQNFAKAFSLTRPYLEGDKPMQPTRQARGSRARSGIRREHGMTLAAKGAAQLAANIRHHDKQRDFRQPAIGAAYDELRQAGTRADRASVAYMGRQAEQSAGRSAQAGIWALRVLRAGVAFSPTIEHRLLERIAGQATGR